ncbi:putative ABC transport system substrate-binding protein [Pseudobutyrivibrio sp. YE44]|uniref:ABC transporter substrate-binding protein n=1 Tax=Pseudobutyrivibrio sp. YE44 TaxID=1520802 RepID=UPI00088826FE|nr:ABC transporter substrate-binding protein [Pseudobutyrivibrio sp. YE44]SDB43271.1 putative ABC transport system substrate-binding protein [Pseudobutyrivibrio sp. YE44]
MKKAISLLAAMTLAISLVGCGTDAAAKKEADKAQGETTTEQATSDADSTYNVGIIQLVQHPALDAATEGFQAALAEKLGDKVSFTLENASGDIPNCATIANSFVSDKVDLIMANATPALQACETATSDIPIVATSITDYASALDIKDWTGATGVNVTGTSDLAPLDGQADMLHELFPDAKEVGLIYCSGEVNSIYQANEVTKSLEKYGYNVTAYTFSDSSDVGTVVQTACGASDVLYVPTDNVAANCAETINNVAVTAKVPIVAGEEGICKGCGIATLSISYYDIGYAAGLMAYEILANGADPATMDIQYATDFTKEYNPTIAETLGIKLPEDYVAIEME